METLKLRMEKQGRAGKTVTMVEGFTREKRLMEEILSGLRRALATGGTVRERTLVLQGDHRVKLREIFRGQGFSVKG